MLNSCYKSVNRDFTLVQGDCCETLEQFEFKFDMIFADPPYFLSNGGISCQSGKVVCVDKGSWDKGMTQDGMDNFNARWLGLCREKLKPNGTIWVCGTYHNIFSVGNALLRQGYKILNVVTWAKTNPPPNISCRYFTYSSEFLIWARREAGTPHFFNYQLMKELNQGKQMRDVWQLPAIGKWEKRHGQHPTQKPLALAVRAILASTPIGAWVLDPFAGSGTTGIASSLCGRRFLGLEKEGDYLSLAKARRQGLDDGDERSLVLSHLPEAVEGTSSCCEEEEECYGLPF